MTEVAAPFGLLLSARSAEDVLGRRIEVTLGGKSYVMPVRPRAAMRRWQASLDGAFASGLAGLAQSDELGEVYAALFGMSDQFLDALVAYDAAEPAFGVLPSREQIDEQATEFEILTAVLEVWRAANPLAALALTSQLAIQTNGSSEQPSSSPKPTAGGRNGSRRTGRKS